MALIKCSECGKEISDKADNCPNCGCPVDKVQDMSERIDMNTTPITRSQVPQKKNRGCLIGLIIFCLFLCGVGVGVNEIIKHPEKYQKESETVNTDVSKKSKKKTTKEKAKKEKKEVANLQVVSHDSVAEEYSRYVVGKIKNNTSHTYSYVQVEINLYNGDALIGSTLDNVNNLEPGQTWEFKAIITDDNCTSYKIVDVTGF